MKGAKSMSRSRPHSPLTVGMTVVDWWGVTGRPVNARFLNTVDADGFY